MRSGGIRQVRRTRRGFTLLELLLVILLLGLLVGLAWPDLFASGKAEQLPESVSRFRSLVAMARAEAMNQSRRYRIRFWQDGTLDVRQQSDPLEAPQDYVPIVDTWGKTTILLEDVWVESLLKLDQGPPPILVEDNSIEFTQLEEKLKAISEYEQPLDLFFEPDGSSPSLRLVLRDKLGRGVQVTLDGRLGRVDFETAPMLKDDKIERPALLEKKEEQTSSLGGYR